MKVLLPEPVDDDEEWRVEVAMVLAVARSSLAVVDAVSSLGIVEPGARMIGGDEGTGLF